MAARAVAALALGLPPEVAPVAMRARPMDSLQRLAGTYRFGDDFYVPRGTLQIVARDDGLYDVGRSPEIGFLPLADGGFLYRAAWSPVRFQADAVGRLLSLTFDGRFRAVRMSEAAASSRKE